MTALLTTSSPSPSHGTAERRAQRTRWLLERMTHESDPHARRRLCDEVVRCNLDVACGIAAHYSGRGLELEDLQQVAALGLVKAVQRFRSDVGGTFLAFARPTIRGEVRRHFRDTAWVVRPPRRLQELHADVRAASSRLEQELGASPSSAQLARDVGAGTDAVAEARELHGCYSPTSLDARRGEHRTAPADDLAAPGGDPGEAVVQRLALTTALRTLDDSDRRLLQLRFEDELTQEEIGQRLGVSQMQVSRRLRRVLDRLRRQLDAA